jgi:predicted small secreted protein
MHKSLNKLLLAVTIITSVSACTTLKEVGKDIGQTTKKVTTEIGHATRDVAKKTVKAIKEN